MNQAVARFGRRATRVDVLALVLASVFVSACTSTASAPVKSPQTATAATSGVALAATTGGSSAQSGVSIGDVLVTCLPNGNHSNYTYYDSANGHVLRTLSYDDSDADPNAPIKPYVTCVGTWNADYSKRVYSATVPNNGTLPEVNDRQSKQIIGASAAPAAFVSTNHNLQDVRFGPDGHVWWINRTGDSGQDFVVYRDDVVVHTFKDTPDNGQYTLEFSGNSYEIAFHFGSPDGDNYWLLPKPGANGWTQTMKDPFTPSNSGVMDDSLFQKLLPPTDHGIGSAGFYSTDRRNIYFVATTEAQNDTAVYRMPVSGGNPMRLFALKDPLEELLAVVPPT
jgi:hypothetical protein